MEQKYLKKISILIVEDKEDDYKRLKKELITYFNSEPDFDNPNVIAQVKMSTEALEIFKSKETVSLNIQAVFLDWQLDGESTDKTVELLKAFKEYRPNVPVYLLTQTEAGGEIIGKFGDYKLDGYFVKPQENEAYTQVISALKRDLKNRYETPFWTAFKKYVENAQNAWHTPGHSDGRSFKESNYLKEFYDFWGRNVFAGDLSVSVEHLGSLLNSTAFIGEAQEKAINTFGTWRTFFATNGSSTSNKVMLQSIIRPGDKVIVDRNCHKSIHYGCIQAGAKVDYLMSEYCSELDMFAPPSLNEIEEKINNNTDAKLLVITGCTYDGLLIDVKKVVELVKKHNAEKTTNLKLFIDEAWFAYSSFHPAYYAYSALKAGADYVTHSTHKVLSAFSQASYMHINDHYFDEEFFREIFHIYTSTSPQYQMIASLDVARMQMEMEGYKMIEETRQLVEYFIETITSYKLRHIKVLSGITLKTYFSNIENDNVGHDLLKVTLDVSGLKTEMSKILKFLREHGKLEVEKSTETTIMILFTIGANQEKVNSLLNAIKNLDNEKVGNTEFEKQEGLERITSVEIMTETLAEAFFYNGQCRQEKKISDLIDEIEKQHKVYLSAALVTPYPPGIPVLVPGQKITKEHLEYIRDKAGNGTEVHGCHKNKLKVIDYEKYKLDKENHNPKTVSE